MKTGLRLPSLTLTAGLSAALASCTSTPVKPTDASGPSLAELVSVVQEAIDPFWCSPDKPAKSAAECKADLPPLKQVKLSLQAVHDTKVVGQLDYLILSAQASKDAANTQQIDLTLSPTPPAGLKVQYVKPEAFADVEKTLHDLVDSARNGIKSTYTVNEKTLYTSGIDVQVAFAVTWGGKVGASKWSILFLSASPSIEHSVKTTNTITISFANAPGKP